MVATSRGKNCAMKGIGERCDPLTFRYVDANRNFIVALGRFDKFSSEIQHSSVLCLEY